MEPSRKTPAGVRLLAAAALALLLTTTTAVAEDAPRVLFLSKSSTFIHSVIAPRDGGPSVAEAALRQLADEHGFELVATKDAGTIRADVLDDFDAVIFFTTGDLTKSGGEKHLLGGDGEPAMAEDGLEELLAWIRRGGGFLGFHSAADTFHGEAGTVSPYIAMLGGEFETHGQPFEGTLRVVAPEHPAIRALPDGHRFTDEWYLFRNLDEDGIEVLAKLDPAAAAEEQAIYRRDPYPVIWVKSWGDGRVYYNAMGHEEALWSDATFRQLVVDALRWAIDDESGD